MKNKIITSEGNIQFIDSEGKVINISPSQVYSMINEDTVSFLLVHLPKSSGLSLFTTKVEDLELNGATYSQSTIADALAEAFSEAGAVGRIEVVDELPSEGKTNTIYLLPKDEGEGYDEYIYIKDESKWELIGDTSIEIKNFLKKSDFNEYSAATKTAIDNEIDARESSDSVISGAVDSLSTDLLNESQRAQNVENSLDSKITAVSGAVDTKQDALIAGENISISGNVISAKSVDVDPSLDSGSTNPVANSAITNAINTLTSDKFDFVGTAGYTSYDGLYFAANNIQKGSVYFSKVNGNSIVSAIQMDNLQLVETSAITTSVTSASTDTQVPSAKAVYDALQEGGGGKAIEAGRGISVTTGETADTVSFNLPIYAGTGNYSIREGLNTKANGDYSHAEGKDTEASTAWSHAEGLNTKASGVASHAEGSFTVASGQDSHAEGSGTKVYSQYSHAEGYFTSASSVSNVSGINVYNGYDTRHAEGSNTLANNGSTHTEGYYTVANNFGEHASGVYNNSTSASTTFGDSGNTLFSVGNGTATNKRHNAFEIRQNGDIYITKDGQDVKLQDQLGGGGGMDDNTQQLIATSLVDLNDRKADKSLLSIYATKSDLDAKANASEVMTLAKATENEKITASALNELNNRIKALEEAIQALQNN